LDVLDLCLVLLRARIWPVLRISGWVLVPAVAGLLALWAFGLDWWAVGAALLLLPVVRAPFTVLGGKLLFADDASTREVLTTTLRLVPGLSLVWVAQGLATVAAACTLVGLLLLGMTAWLPETALLERVDLGRGVRRVVRLAAAHPIHAAAAGGSGVLLTLWGALLGEQLGQTLVGFVLQLGEPFGSLMSGTVTPYLLVGIIVVQPIIVWYRLLLYVDCRTRAEGWDLQVALRALDLGSRR
jgi:hypothetical protein